MINLFKKSKIEEIKDENIINDIKIEILKAKKNGQKNINLIIDREEQLIDLQRKAEDLKNDSQLFYKQSKKNKNNTFSKKIRMFLLLLFIFLIFLYVILVFNCGFNLKKCL